MFYFRIFVCSLFVACMFLFVYKRKNYLYFEVLTSINSHIYLIESLLPEAETPIESQRQIVSDE